MFLFVVFQFDVCFEVFIVWLYLFVGCYVFDLLIFVFVLLDVSFCCYFWVVLVISVGGMLIVVDVLLFEKCCEFVQVVQLFVVVGDYVFDVLVYDFDVGFMFVIDFGCKLYILVFDLVDLVVVWLLMCVVFDVLICFQFMLKFDVLLLFDEVFLCCEMELLFEWFVGCYFGKLVIDVMCGMFECIFVLLVVSVYVQLQGFMLCDFMLCNLMVCELNFGVFDFQDVVYGLLMYDVVLLLCDVFISWDEEFEFDCFVYYWEKVKKVGLLVDLDFGEFYCQFEWMGLQCYIKIFGLFVCINYCDGKLYYLNDLLCFFVYVCKVVLCYCLFVLFVKLFDEFEGNVLVDVGYMF